MKSLETIDRGQHGDCVFADIINRIEINAEWLADNEGPIGDWLRTVNAGHAPPIRRCLATAPARTRRDVTSLSAVAQVAENDLLGFENAD